MVLKAQEELIMDILWDAQGPMTSMEMLEQLPENAAGGKGNINIHRHLKALLANQCITISDHVLIGKQKVRLFRPLLTREDYSIQLIKEKNMKSPSLAKIALGLAKEAEANKKKDEISDELIEQLEQMVRDLKETKEE